MWFEGKGQFESLWKLSGDVNKYVRFCISGLEMFSISR